MSLNNQLCLLDFLCVTSVVLTFLISSINRFLYNQNYSDFFYKDKVPLSEKVSPLAVLFILQENNATFSI